MNASYVEGRTCSIDKGPAATEKLSSMLRAN